MPRALADDGVELHWEERGSGPTVVIVPHWSLHPSLWEPITLELERDHRVVRYDDRGTGQSDRSGPYDLETAAEDLEAVAASAGDGPAVALGLMDGTNRAVRAAARRPDLIAHVVSSGGAPLPRRTLSDSDSMIASDTVVGAFMQQLEADYRGAIRGILEAANPQMSRDELRQRVAGQVGHVPRDVAAIRVRAWADDEGAAAPARELGDRLVILLAEEITGGWFPDARQMRAELAKHIPDAIVEDVDDGVLSRPDQTAAAVRRLTAAVGAGSSDLESRS